MTKSLTELWKDGELPDGYYYIDYDTQQKIFEVEDGCATYQGLPAETYFLNDVCLIKVISPVPSWDHFSQKVKKVKKLKEQLSSITLQLKEANDIIKEYVETIPKVPNDGWHIPNYNLDNAEGYLKKWGVK